ncbi:MAG TPA: site-2 protease family protein, partial [Gaiellaceae bacterium]
MGFVAAIVGLALLVLIHEAGHFFAARAVGMTPRKFYLGFGPPIVKVVRGKVEYGIGALPLGGYVKIPGMSRPSAGDLAATLPPEQREAHREGLARLDAELERGDYAAARASLAELRPRLDDSRYVQELEWSLEPDAYWRQATWRRLVAIAAGPAINLVFAIVLFTALFLVATTRETNRIARVQTASPAAATGLHAGDRVVAIRGRPVTAKQIPSAIRATEGRPFRLVVERRGQRVTLGPVRARMSGGAYRIGIAIEARQGPGESLPAAAGDALGLSWSVTADTV